MLFGMRVMTWAMALLLATAVPALAQTNLFRPELLERADVKAAMQSVDGAGERDRR